MKRTQEGKRRLYEYTGNVGCEIHIDVDTFFFLPTGQGTASLKFRLEFISVSG